MQAIIWPHPAPSAWLNTSSGWRRWVFRSRPDLVNLALPGELRSRPSVPSLLELSKTTMIAKPI